MKCNHDWVYEQILYLTYPPCQKKICRVCGKKEPVFIELDNKEENYKEVEERFKNAVQPIPKK